MSYNDVKYVKLPSRLIASFPLTLIDQFEVQDPPSDAISALRFSPYPGSYKFVVASWDKHAYLYEISDNKQCTLLNKFEHRAPVLDVCFGKDDQEIYTACLDWDVRRYALLEPMEIQCQY